MASMLGGPSGVALRAIKEEDVQKRRISSKIWLCYYDICTLRIDAIVNPSNQALQPGGGANGQIHRKAGPKLYQECKTLKGCSIGEAKITKGYQLPAKHVIHTVGPRNQEKQVLAQCYINCLRKCETNNLRAVAFPCISTGAFGYDHEQAANVALSNVRAYLMADLAKGKNSFDKIVFCVFSERDKSIYEGLLPVYFPGFSRLDSSFVKA
ncbi:MACRO domain-containing protein 2 [Zychaea mexicana]|uniref:MACRO domain-containing protein 2 n=1 Tax=Zychaea mexicana TaxID=64656 RepID=UPI0022FDEF1B|nr:MACRO domain-containing protein 2 [Zychaea mexicana]KAI9498848.1 MACRO domain-containing protein 2 [Zychaea mexicana]